MKKGKVYIVGAGPGNSKLITVRGYELLKEADAVVYDRLIGNGLLKCTKESALHINVGKMPDMHLVPQDEINNILVDLANKGLNVVRLKGGDPFIFGRGAEECLALKENGIEFEVVPGIASALGASSFSGIPLTHRNSVVQCLFVTAHESPDKSVPQVDWESIANLKNTSIVIFMGVSKIESVAAKLMNFGRSPDELVSIVENATFPNQRVVITTLGKVAEDAKINNIVAPSLIIISPTISMHNELYWLDNNDSGGK